jgi:hypothetical protein
MDLLLDNDPTSPSYGDLTFKNGSLTPDFTTQSRTEVVAQRLWIRLRTFRTEWFLDEGYGVPYWNILGKKISKAQVDLIFQREILAEAGVTEITAFESSIKNRQYSMSFRVRVSTGDETDTITINPTN